MVEDNSSLATQLQLVKYNMMETERILNDKVDALEYDIRSLEEKFARALEVNQKITMANETWTEENSVHKKTIKNLKKELESTK